MSVQISDKGRTFSGQALADYFTKFSITINLALNDKPPALPHTKLRPQKLSPAADAGKKL